jgi:hypothetical protein
MHRTTLTFASLAAAAWLAGCATQPQAMNYGHPALNAAAAPPVVVVQHPVYVAAPIHAPAPVYVPAYYGGAYAAPDGGPAPAPAQPAPPPTPPTPPPVAGCAMDACSDGAAAAQVWRALRASWRTRLASSGQLAPLFMKIICRLHNSASSS